MLVTSNILLPESFILPSVHRVFLLRKVVTMSRAFTVGLLSYFIASQLCLIIHRSSLTTGIAVSIALMSTSFMNWLVIVSREVIA